MLNSIPEENIDFDNISRSYLKLKIVVFKPHITFILEGTTPRAQATSQQKRKVKLT